MLPVKQQWGKARSQLVSGLAKNKQKTMMEKYDKIWEELQKQGKVPKDEEGKKLSLFLGKAEEQAKLEVEKYMKGKKGSILVRRKWTKEGGEKKDRRIHLHNMTLACMAVETLQKRVGGTSTIELTKTTEKAGPSAPLYPKLPAVQLPPPYPVTQMPLMHVQDGVLDVQELRTREYNVVKERLAEAVEESIRKVEKLTLEVDQRVKEAEEANRVMMTHSRNKEQPKQGRYLAVQEPDAHSTLSSAENEKRGRLHDSGQLLDDGFSDRRKRDLREERDREKLDGDESKSSIDIEDEESLTEDDSNTYPVTLKGSLTMHTEYGSPLKPLPEPSYNLRQRDTLRQPIKYQHHQVPLIYRGSYMEDVYQPFTYTDMNCILDKMPPPMEGGGPWMTKFSQYTLGHKLAMGDWRALLGKQLSKWEIQQIEASAGTTLLPDSVPFAQHATCVGRAMRERFPIPKGATHSLTFTMKEGEDMLAFLARCKGTLTDTAGSHPGSGQLQITLFRNAVIAGMPKEVKEAMESNPDIPGCSTEQWEKHLTHHMKCYRTKQDEGKQSNESAQVQLLKLQLDEARRKANDTRKASQKTTNEMVQQPSPQNNLPSLDPTPDWMPHHLPMGAGL
ncbi:hypothetical protein chiPu_0006602 [Chiloscyllium punctatum]|uniref:Uncharacterized protein n=1 Tax=Chiloscyllium punctatum TaxID=137246 RepID=A0A401SCV0_CHIPU|nr:hypothetical protein [Chiloscyllium punctatum]